MDLMKERLESLKAGILGGLCLAIAYISLSFLNNLVLAEIFPVFASLKREILDISWFFDAGIAAFCGLLFGVTYRYIIRADNNPQLKAGGIMAFGLVRGLTQIETGLNYSSNFLPLVVMGIESVIGFAIAGLVITQAINRSWIKPFDNSFESGND